MEEGDDSGEGATWLELFVLFSIHSGEVAKEHEVRRRDLLILKYDKQRSLCDEIILRQQKLIEGERRSEHNNS